MILWVVLLCLVVAISFVLATQSMRDFTQVPKAEEYGLFLIRSIQGFNPAFLNSIRIGLLESKTIISFERLFKGKKSALVVFGPKRLVLNHQKSLDLLELEDYTNVDVENISAWEVGLKKDAKLTQKLFTNLPHFLENEQFWWQMVFSSLFKPQITAVVVATDSTKKHSLTQALQNFAPEKIQKLPKAFSNAQLLDSYQKRSFKKEDRNQNLSFEEILHLLLI